ncbi:uncharacterized protein [Diadema setosum]|uniref:uncharacterized protein n=1 Tax=Diadema setosum TaxID=31175 RepID=UPI003B3B55D6
MSHQKNKGPSKAEHSKILRSLQFKNPGKKVQEFANFKPEESEREKRKLRRLQEEETLRRRGQCTMTKVISQKLDKISVIVWIKIAQAVTIHAKPAIP